MKFLFSFIFFGVLSLNAEEASNIISIETHVSSMVNDCVNAITGDYIQHANDIVVVGPEPLIFERFSSSSDYATDFFCSGWRHNHLSRIEREYITDKDDRRLRLTFTETSGRCALYEGNYHSGYSTVKSKLLLAGSNAGLTNTGSGLVSARTNPKNVKLYYDRDTHDITVKIPNGSKSHYSKHRDFDHYSLDYELKPNFHKLVYHYAKNGKLEQVKLCNTADQQLSSLEISPKKDHEITVSASDGQKVIYTLERGEDVKGDSKDHKRYLITSVKRYLPTESRYVETDCYEYEKRKGNGGNAITLHRQPEGRYQKVTYYTNEDPEVESKYGFPFRQVKQLLAPVGVDETPIVTHTFRYTRDKDKPGKHIAHTDVFDAYNRKETYHYRNLRLTALERYQENGQLYSKERYYWGDNGTPDACNLISRSIRNGAGKYIVARVFEYDEHGNVLHEKLYGEITGHSQPLHWGGSYPAGTGCDHYDKHYTYTDNSRHLLSMETEDNGKLTEYSYHSGTDLLRRKLIKASGKILIRHFYTYDVNGVLIKEVVDNGVGTEENQLNGVTVRKITYTYPRKTAPIGLPEREDQFYWDPVSQQEKLLRRICRHFCAQGKLLKEDHYDCNGQFGYSLQWDYDAFGNLIKEVDAKGAITEKRYDRNRNLLSERLVGSSYRTEFAYDYSNRLIRSEQIHQNGTRLTTTHQYDLVGNRISTTDPYGQTTEYRYDEFKRLIQITYPPLVQENGKTIRPVEKKEYDLLGNLTRAINPLGERVETSYNIHGKPIQIRYPDGSKELFTYNLDGGLRKHTARNGVSTVYTRDVLNRIIKQEVYSADQTLLSQESFVFDGMHLLSAVDAEGQETRYQYDGAGRLISRQVGNSLTTYEYDSFSRLYKTHAWYDSTHCQTTVHLYNPAGQLIEEQIQAEGELFKKIQFAYDLAGNLTTRQESTPLGEATSYTEYNWHKQPTKTIDPQGNTVIISYDYQTFDPYGYRVLQTTLTDPLGNQTITTHNTHGKVASIIKKNGFGKIIAKKELFYSPLGQVKLTQETAIASAQPDRIVKTRWKLDSFHQVHELIEAEGTPEEKHSHFRYNSLGQKICQMKPDGTEICSTYDSKGRLAHQSASDNSFSYLYHYDRTDRVIRVDDLIHNQSTVRQYNLNGQLISEQLGHGLTFQYQYDALNRPTEVILPDNSTIQYRYNGCNLLAAERKGKVISYEAFHQIAHPSRILLPNHAGQITIDYDILARPTKIAAADLVEKTGYDAVGNLIWSDIQGKVSQYTYDDLYQLQTEQGVATHSYLSDSLYNCIQRDGTTRVFNSLNQLIQEGDTSYVYNANGCLIRKETAGHKVEYDYDAFDRLICIKTDEALTTYTYDAFHRRLTKQTGDQLLHYLYQGENEVGCYQNGNISQLRILGIGKGAEIGASLMVELLGQSYYPIHDHNGNILALIDDTGTVQESYRYSAFGEEKIFDKNSEVMLSSAIENPWRFSSKRIDEESGLIYFGRRYYDPTSCRWITPDPLGFEAGPNLYAYLMNNPLNQIDLYGLIASKAEANSTGFFPQFFQAMHRSLDFIKELPGRCINYMSLHLIPIPVVSNVMQACGRFLSGQGLSWQSWHDYDHCENFTVNGERTEGIIESFFHGMLNIKNDAEQMLTSNNCALSGKEVYSIHGSSHGFFADLIECAALMLGMRTRSVYKAAEGIKEKLEGLGEGEILHCTAHSQGGLILDRALDLIPREERRKIAVTTLGSAKIIDGGNKGVLSAYNYVSLKDPVPFIADPVGCLRGATSAYGNVTFIRSKGLFGADHAFLSENYQHYLNRDISRLEQAKRKR